MKKVDEATGMIIEVPNTTAIRSKFPYPGFWAAVYPNLSSAIRQHALPSSNRSEIDSALKMLIDMMNGEQAVILTERVYYIGEVMDLNYSLPIEGRAGNGLGYIRASADGGRMAVAAKLFEAPIKAILAQSMGKTTSEQSLTSLMNERNSYKAELERLTIQLRDLEKGASSRSALEGMSIELEKLQNQVLHCENAIATREQQIAEISIMRQEYDRVKGQHDKDAAEINNLRRSIANANSNEMRAAAQATLAPVQKRYENSGLWLQRTALVSDNRVLKDLQRLQSNQKSELKQLKNTVKTLYDDFYYASVNYEQAVTEGQQVWSRMQQVSNHLQSMESNLANAQSALSTFTELETSKLTRIWVAHLADCRLEVEALLFKAKANEMGAIQGSPTPRLAESFVNQALLTDHNDFLSALMDIEPVITSEEYDLLEEIGRLGLSMAYVPGDARILALKELRKSQRIVVYRNLIEEILSQGQKMDDETRIATFNAGFAQFVFENDNDLAEVKELIRHLTDSRLGYKYGEGL
jgi:predicted  nucleic acid-binding Zn-ribbon protein